MKPKSPAIQWCKKCDCLRGSQDSGYPCPEGGDHVWTSRHALPTPRQNPPSNF